MAKDRFQLVNLLATILISVVIGEKLNNGGIAYDIEVDLEKLIETQRYHGFNISLLVFKGILLIITTVGEV